LRLRPISLSAYGFRQGERVAEHFVDAHGLRRVRPGLERVIAIANEISWDLIPGERVAQLLHGPPEDTIRSSQP
jgi:hypothetical protein